MRIIAVLALALAASALTASGQSLSKRANQSADERKILQFEQEWMDAMKRRDEATLNQFLGPEFTLAGLASFDDDPENKPVPKATWVDNTLHNLRVESFSFDKTLVRIFGDAATVQAIFTWRGAFKGEPFIDTVLLVDTWLRRSGKWQVVSRLVEGYSKPATR